MKKYVGPGAFAAAMMIGSALPAFAASSGSFSLSASGVAFERASYDWVPVGSCGGASEGFNCGGTLRDTQADGDGVFVHAAVDGYGWAPKIYNSSGAGRVRSIRQTNIHATGDVCYHTSGRVEVCRDRNAPWPDRCDVKSFRR